MIGTTSNSPCYQTLVIFHLADGFSDKNLSVTLVSIHDHSITGHPDDGHTMAPILDDAPPADISTEGWLLDKQYMTTLACLSMVLLPTPITIEN